jgi:hypothetical protein
MKLGIAQILFVLVGLGAYLGVLVFVDKSLKPRHRPWFRYAAVIVTVGLAFVALGDWLPINYDRANEIAKAAIAIAAAACVFYEQHRKAIGRPVAERWKRFVGLSLAIAAIGAYFNGFRFGYPKYYHRWDQYHYYMGAKYFPELGYKNLYKCAVVAQDDIGQHRYHLDRPFGGDATSERVEDFREEMRDPDKKVRDLPGENLLIPVTEILANGDECRSRFSPERWEQYKRDVAFFRTVSGRSWWGDMQKDHGFNPPPVWTIAGKFFSDIATNANVQYQQFLASIDVMYLIGMFIALWWGFGWRVFAVGAIFWGCQSSAPFYWTGGALLRQDWLFFTVLSVACLRRRHFKTAGAALVYAGLLRVFPGLVVIGTLVPVIVHLVKHRRMHRDHKKMLAGGCLAAAILIPLSIYMSGDPNKPIFESGIPMKERAARAIAPYKTFYEHTIETHDQTPLTNHMGLRVIIGHKFFDFQKPGLRTADEQAEWKESLEGFSRRFSWTAPIRMPIKLSSGKESGQMQYVRDNNLLDPFENWKRMRNERYERYKKVAYGLSLLSFAFFFLVVRRIKSLWVAQCLGQIFIILGSQLTCYYYSFMILGAPLIKWRRPIELGLFALAAVTEIIWMNSYWNDNKYTLLTIVSLIFCYFLIGMFWRRRPSADAANEELADDAEEEEEAEEDEEDERAPVKTKNGRAAQQPA